MGEAATFPEKLSIFQVIASNAIRGGDDDLRRALVQEDVGRGPRGGFVSLFSPAFFSGVFIESNDKGRSFVIPVDDKSLTVEGGGAAL